MRAARGNSWIHGLQSDDRYDCQLLEPAFVDSCAPVISSSWAPLSLAASCRGGCDAPLHRYVGIPV